MAISVFISTVSDEFRIYRDQLVHDLTRQNVAVKVQEDFKDLGGDTLDKLDVYIAHCDAVVHLVGDMCGAVADERQQQALHFKHPDMAEKLPPLGEPLKSGACLPYTQWEAWLALYHGKPLMIAQAREVAPRGPNYKPTDASREGQSEHLKRLKAFHRYPGSEFASPEELAKQLAYTVILDLLVEDYAKKAAQEREVAKGFIEEMARRVAGDKALDLDGMKQAVRNAIEIYENEIAGRPVETNFDDVVNRALARAKDQVDRGQSRLARATLRKAAEQVRRDEEERRERYVLSVTALYHRERDIALAAYDGDAAAEAILELASSIHGALAETLEFLNSEAQLLFEYGRDRGSNVHLVASIALRRSLAEEQSTNGNGLALANLGLALWTLGDREAASEKLEEAVRVYQASLEKLTWEGAPLEWVTTQSNLAYAFFTLGERESGTGRLEEAVMAYRVALDERIRERLPLAWALTQSYLGLALWRLGERESGTGRLEEAVVACRAALEETPFEQAPLNWADIQNSLGNALSTLGARENATTHLQEGVVAYRAAQKVWTRDRAPLDWATAHNNLGTCLIALGEREMGTSQLEEAVAVFGEVLEEWTRKRVPLDWATAQTNLGVALAMLGERESESTRLEEAVVAHRLALEERTRERLPLDWATTQAGLGYALRALGERQDGTETLDWAVGAYRAALEEGTRERVPFDWAASFGNQGRTMMLIADRTSDVFLAETALTQIESAYETLRDGGHEVWAASFEAQLPKAQAIRDRLKGK